jgi:hypothetical protein
MSTQADFTEQQWQALVEAPKAAAMGVVVVDFGLVDFAKEAAVMVRFAQQAQALYAHHPLIQAVVAEMTSPERTTGWHVPWRQLSDGLLPGAESRPQRIAARLLAKVNEAVRVLDEHVDVDSAQAFKEFVYTYAERVAQASGEGWFGLGEPVSAKEAAFLDELRAVLGL